MTIPTDLDRRFRDTAVALRSARRGLRRDRQPSSARCSPPSPTTGSPASRTTPSPSASSRRSPGWRARASCERRGALDETRRELDDYFAGDGPRSTSSSTCAAWRRSRSRPRRAREGPYGHTATYGELAERAGNPRAARAVGMVMNRNPIPIVLPCHRIVGASGSLVGYGGGLERKEHLLRLEGAML